MNNSKIVPSGSSSETTPSKREARPTCGKEQKILDKIIELAESAQKRVDCNFGSLLAKHKMRNIDMLNELYPIVRDQQQMSKLISGAQHVNLEILVALHYVFHVDLNEFIAGDSSSKPVFPFDVQKAIDILAQYQSGCKNGK